MISPGSSRTSTFHSTLRSRLCAIVLEKDVNMMLVMDVPSARSMSVSCGKCSQLNAKTSMGTMTMPPPTPSSPARMPARAPSEQ